MQGHTGLHGEGWGYGAVVVWVISTWAIPNPAPNAAMTVALPSGRMRTEAGRYADGATVAVQGFGNVGSWAAHSLAALGARVVAVSDVRGGIYTNVIAEHRKKGWKPLPAVDLPSMPMERGLVG